MTVEQVTLSYNLPWAMAGLFVAVVCGIILVTRRDRLNTDSFYFVLGQFIEGVAVFIHRMYWTVARYLRGIGEHTKADILWSQADILLPVVALMIIGTGLFMRGFLYEIFGRWWLAAWVGQAGVWAFVGFYAIPITQAG